MKEGVLECVLCPNHCRLREGEFGTCRVRVNRGGDLDLPFYGVLSAVSNDPIEKKPLYHFYPGSTIFSVGFYGCSFHCPFCQNYTIAQSTPAENSKPRTSPQDLVDSAISHGAKSIAYTYSEPTIHFEWVLDTARIARDRGLKNILVSNGYLNPEPTRELLDSMDGANIDLKSNREEFYRDEIGGHLAPIKVFLKEASRRTHLEVTTLVIPNRTDSDDEIDEIARFISTLDSNIPLHLSCYYPAYTYTLPPTDPDTVFHLTEVAKRHLNYVYPGNVGLTEVVTTCPNCGNTLITRREYHVEMTGIEGKKCDRCGRPVTFPV